MDYGIVSVILMVLPLAVALVAQMVREHREFVQHVNGLHEMKAKALDLNTRMAQDLKDMNALLERHPS